MSVFGRNFYLRFAFLALFLLLCDVTEAKRTSSSSSSSKGKGYSSYSSSSRISQPSQSRGYASMDTAKFSYSANQPANYKPISMPARRPANPDMAKFSYVPAKPITPPAQSFNVPRVQSAPVPAPAPFAPIMNTPNQQTASSYLSPSYHNSPSFPSAPPLPKNPQISQPIGWKGTNDLNKPQIPSAPQYPSGQSFPQSQFPSSNSFPSSGSTNPSWASAYPSGGSSFPSGGSSFPTGVNSFPSGGSSFPSGGSSYPSGGSSFPTGGNSFPSGRNSFPSNTHLSNQQQANYNFPSSSNNYPQQSFGGAPNYPTGGYSGYNHGPPPPIHTVVHHVDNGRRGGGGFGGGLGSAAGGFAAGYLVNDLASSIGNSGNKRPIEITSSTVIVQQPTTNPQPAPVVAQPIEPYVPPPVVPLAPYPENSPFAPLNVDGPVTTTTVPTTAEAVQSIVPQASTDPSLPAVTQDQSAQNSQSDILASTVQNLPEIISTQSVPSTVIDETIPNVAVSEPQNLYPTLPSSQEPISIDDLSVIPVSSNTATTISTPEEILTTILSNAEPISTEIPTIVSEEKLTTILSNAEPISTVIPTESVPIVSETVDRQTTTNLLNALPTVPVSIAPDSTVPEESFNIRFASTEATDSSTIIEDITNSEVTHSISTTQIAEETTTSTTALPTVAPIANEEKPGFFSRFKSTIKKIFS